MCQTEDSACFAKHCEINRSILVWRSKPTPFWDVCGVSFMDIDAYKSSLRSCDGEISEMENRIKTIRSQISETEKAKENAKGIRTDFDSFVSRKKQANSGKMRPNLLKSFSSFLNKATALLTGTEYNKANDSIEEINRMLNSKLKTLQNDLDYCQKELARLKNQRNSIYSEYVKLLNTQQESEDS